MSNSPIANTDQAEAWNNAEGLHWAAHQDRYDALNYEFTERLPLSKRTTSSSTSAAVTARPLASLLAGHQRAAPWAWTCLRRCSDVPPPLQPAKAPPTRAEPSATCPGRTGVATSGRSAGGVIDQIWGLWRRSCRATVTAAIRTITAMTR